MTAVVHYEPVVVKIKAYQSWSAETHYLWGLSFRCPLLVGRVYLVRLRIKSIASTGKVNRRLEMLEKGRREEVLDKLRRNAGSIMD